MELEKIWSPSKNDCDNAEELAIVSFQKSIESRYQLAFASYGDFHRWSVENNGKFWSALLDYFGVHTNGERDENNHEDFSSLTYPWFPKLQLSFSYEILKPCMNNLDKVFLQVVTEKDTSGETCDRNYRSHYRGRDILANVLLISQQMQNILGDIDLSRPPVVAAYMPNIAQTIFSCLAANSLGAIFTSTSCDFGVSAVVDRFSQSQPNVLVMCTGYFYNNKYIDLTPRISELQKALPSVKKILLVDFYGRFAADIPEGCEMLASLSDASKIEKLNGQDFKNQLTFTLTPFNYPLYIMYSSGTTGKPKCIVHGAGGTLLQHLKEVSLHSNVKNSDRMCFFTTCGWMMWNWMLSAMALGAELVLYEGSPASPSPVHYMKLMQKLKVTHLGTSPKFLKALELAMEGQGSLNMQDLKVLFSTGAPLLMEQYDFVYEKIYHNLHLASISGGTDIIGCFMLGHPGLPVYRGEIQCLGLGMDVACFNEQGEKVIDQEGELVCLRPFVSQPLGFLNDEKQQKYREAYFEKFAKTWTHGDFIRISSQGSVKVFGRSDSTLNPGGVRIGTGEIYRQTEQLAEIADSLCVGVSVKGEVEVWLFVVLRGDHELTEELQKLIKKQIRDNTTPRHVPKKIIKVSQIPYTRSGKKMEVPMSRLLNGRAIENYSAVANPECIAEYERYQVEGSSI